MTFRFCDDLGHHGFGWIAEEAMTRTSHVIAANGRTWFVDPLDWSEAIGRALGLGKPAGVIQLLDRHNRDCATLAGQLDVPHVVVPDELPGTPFVFVQVMRRKRWRESALWWAETRTLVLADALATNSFFTGGKAPIGVHPLLALTPPKALLELAPENVLVGHGEGLSGSEATTALHEAVRASRRRLPGVLVRLPFAGRGQ